MIVEDEWDFKPCALYKPPVMDFSKTKDIKKEIDLSFEKCTKSYYNVLKEVSQWD